MIIVAIRRAWWVGVLLALCAAWAQAAPLLRLASAGPTLNLARQMETLRLPAGAPLDPDTLWEAPAQAPNPAEDSWRLRAGEQRVGRFSVAALAEGQKQVLQLPMPQVDEVRLWWRRRGEAWQWAQAGDRVPMSTWPFASPFPAFPIDVGAEPVDVIVAVANGATLFVPVTLQPDPAFRENLVLRANLSGVVMGLGAMVVIVCLLGALSYGGRPRWTLAIVATWTLLAVTANNGYTAVWLTGEWPVFNDWARTQSAVILAGLVVLLFSEGLDALYVRPVERAIGIAAPVLALAYAVAQLLWLPTEARVPASVVAAVLSLGCCAVLCALNALRGGRHTIWPALALLAWAGVPVLALVVREQLGSLDLRAAAVAALFYTALLMVRQGISAHDRYGRDVLGRDAISVNRDPLTALWSYDGFQQRYAEAALREAAGQGSPSVLLFMLPGLDHAVVQHGTTLTERTLVRFAAGMQRLLGQGWAVARVSHRRFAAISLRPLKPDELAAVTTQVVSHCARITQPLNLLTEFDLRVAGGERKLADVPLPELLGELRQAALALAPGKRIAHLPAIAERTEPLPPDSLPRA